MSFYVIKIWGAVEPSMEGPFEKIEDRLAQAKEMWKDCNGDNCDNLFKLDIAPGCEPQIFPFLEGELSDEDSEEPDGEKK